MEISRRSFLKYCSASAATLGIVPMTIDALAAALRDPDAPTFLWLQGAGCTGCSVSFLNYFSEEPGAPRDAGDVLINVINLAYHPNLMAAAGETSLGVLETGFAGRDYVLVVEGGVPTAFGGNTCWLGSRDGEDVTFQEAVVTLGGPASAIVCVGSCSAYGGIPAAGGNPTQVQRVSQITGRTTINVPGCPPHPNWLVYVVAEYLAGHTIPLDAYGRPTALFSRTVHQDCPLRNTEEAHGWGQPNRCKEELGCRGEGTRGPCPNEYFNEGANWCIGAGASCIGCTEPGFPGVRAFFEEEDD